MGHFRSYKYEFEHDEYKRKEESDSNGNVIGSYSYVDSDGKTRSLSYRAGAGIGFVPTEARGFSPDIMASFEGFGKRQGPNTFSNSINKRQHTKTQTQKPFDVLQTSSSIQNNRLSSAAYSSKSDYDYRQPTKPDSHYLPPVSGIDV